EGVGPLSPNLGIQSAMLSTCTLHRIDDPHCMQRRIYAQILKRWTDSLKCVFVYDYDPGKSLDGTPFTSLRLLEHDLRRLHERGVWGFWTEGQNIWMVTQLNYYVRSKLMWGVDSDVKAVVRDFCEKFYGPAARPVEEYLWLVEDSLEENGAHAWWSRPIPWMHVLEKSEARLNALVKRAEALAKEDPERARVQVFRDVHDHLRAYAGMERALAEGRFADAGQEVERMAELRKAIDGAQHGLLPPENELVTGHEFSLTTWRDVCADLTARTDGTQGSLVTMLPREWEFHTDPHDEGVIYQWYLPGTGEGWRRIDVTDYWENQGEQDKQGRGYWGKAWYRTTFPVPSEAAGKTLTLTLGGVATDRERNDSRALWVWINGNLIEVPSGRIHHFKPLDLDVSKWIRPGESNDIAILVQANRLEATQHNGLHRRVFLWAGW
ncbi:MAG: DUF4838 domain-containing protein, partial [Candidatus Omnitrophica bacterium]|nr:DUF4838 domain-containing protein [Candidatus Omnitrophota bacterium]